MKIGVFGTGLMGNPLAERLFRNGFDVEVYNRSFEKTENLRAMGIKAYQKAEDLLHAADVYVSMLADFNANEEVFLSGKETFLKGKTLIQMSTVATEENKYLNEKIRLAGGEFLEAPVLGSIPQVKTGELIIMVGGDKILFEKFREFFDVLSSKTVYVGEVGKASALKLALNQLIASLTAAFSTSLALVLEHGVDVDVFMEILRNSALYAPTYDKKLKRMLERNFENPNFPLKHLLKDVDLILRELEKTGINTDLVESVKRIVKRGLEMNLHEKDYSSLYNSVHEK
jgi:3-hydroxyisobutyrate dehydrogenase